MEFQELQDIVLRNSTEITDIHRRLTDLMSKEQRVERALKELRQNLKVWMDAFDRDNYKATDQRLLIRSLAAETIIFHKLGYDIGLEGAYFLLGVAAFLEGRNLAALNYFKQYISEATPEDRNLRNAFYLGAMISYNRRDFIQAADFFRSAFLYSSNQDWQSAIYSGELAFFMRKQQNEIERSFIEVDEALRPLEETTALNFFRATLYLKLGNCYVESFLNPKEINPMTNNSLAIRWYKEARKYCPQNPAPGSLLPVIIDYSLAQSLLLNQSVDMDLSMTPSELLEDVFHRLRRIVLTKREEIILAQCYLMLATCAYYSFHVSKEVGEIYLEQARHQTQVVPSDMSFYSPITKELLTKEEFIKQIDYYDKAFEKQTGRRSL